MLSAIDTSKCEHMAVFKAARGAVRIKSILGFGTAPDHLGGGRTATFQADDGQTYIARLEEVGILHYFTPESLTAALS